jgi:hypothetical protein
VKGALSQSREKIKDFFGSFKGRYAGRIGRQDWKSLNFVPVQRNTPFTLTCKPHQPKPIKKNCPLQKREKIKWRSDDFTKKIAFG